MRVTRGVRLGFFFSLFFLFPLFLQAAGDEPVVTVKLSMEAPFFLEFYGQVELFYRTGSGWTPAAEIKLDPEKVWSVYPGEGGFSLAADTGDRITTAFPLLFAPVQPDRVLRVNGREYAGKIEIRPGPPVSLINHVGLEDYVAGVLGGEVYADWPPPALRAMAVAARSYTLFNLNRHDDFDFCDREHCQKYLGLPRAAAFYEAVEKTRGEVLAWENKVVNAVYHASSGGFTRNNEDVWEGESLPYLRGVEDFDQDGEKYYWTESFFFRAEELAGRLGLSGRGDLEVVPLLSPGGSYTTVSFRRLHEGEKRIFRCGALRRLLGLPGPTFRFFLVEESRLSEAAGRLEEAALGKGVNRDGLIRLEARIMLTLSAGEITGPACIGPGEGVLIIGRGTGHGVGLSQWGARALAEKGYDYRSILTHYYGEGITIKRED